MFHSFIQINGIKIHVAEEGEGDLVILCHGFPECWYSWRYQINVIAEAGFQVIAPDLRGYGQSDCPISIDAYDILQLTEDIAGLVRAYKKEKAIIVGHDWGAVLAWHCVLLKPDIFYGLVLLSVPYIPRTKDLISPIDKMKKISEKNLFYQLYFQKPGLAEKEFEKNIRKTLLKLFYSASGEAYPSNSWNPFLPEPNKFFSDKKISEKLPSWLTPLEFDYFVKEFERTGFRGGLNWYRNIERNWKLTSCLTEKQIEQPTLFIGGKADPIMSIAMYEEAFDNLERNIPNLEQKILLSDGGHWIQQECANPLNKSLVDFLKEISQF